ncbi:hypothetical protein [Streptomyces sp. 5-10]|uniref:hypothetical protein n=1 Tax=Streptomyces sp. 5-10 TaxID=878925 RepID=UPI00168A991E|nr:hypothetical protein [Streptomyces sp. 5-10]MBD3004886.1 hypothetical protein [Streptomyces sp. 5-10]
MFSEPFYLTSMDPGGITGLVTLRIDKKDFTVERQLGDPYDPLHGKTPARTLKSWAENFRDLPQALLYEDFRLHSQGFVPDPTALNVIGGVETWLAGTVDVSSLAPRKAVRAKSSHSRLADLGGAPGCPYEKVISREPVQRSRKYMVTNAILERLGLLAYGPMTTDINDAFRHAVAWLTEQGYRPVCEQAWPRQRLASPA